MTREEAIKILKDLSDCSYIGSLASEDIEALKMAIEALEQEPRKGHWIDKYHLFETCSAECSSCHKRSNGYMHDNGFSLECKYYDFCPNCGADMREVEE